MNANVAGFEETMRAGGRLFVLFYASWCPYPQRFLPIYEKCTRDISSPCLQVVVDDRDDLCQKYYIEVYPTVLLFEKGIVADRLDGLPGEGLDERQLKKLLKRVSEDH